MTTKRAPSPPQAKPTGDSFNESFSEAFSASSPKVDREAGVVRGVKVLGVVSQNGRRYLAEAVRGAKTLYEGAKVNINHSRSEGGGSRLYEDRFGVLQSVEYRENGAASGLYADLRYNPKHRLAEQFAWDAEHSPSAVGLSHVVQGKSVVREGKLIVERIDRVISVDVVADPATTNGLFEDQQNPGNNGQQTGGQQTESNAMTLTLESLKSEHAELVKAILTEQEQSEESKKQTEQLKTLQEELDRLRVEKAASERRAKVDALLAEAKLPKEACSEVFVEQCMGAKDDASLKALVEDRASLWVAGGKSKTQDGKPISKEQQASSIRESRDAKGFAASILL